MSESDSAETARLMREAQEQEAAEKAKAQAAVDAIQDPDERARAQARLNQAYGGPSPSTPLPKKDQR